MCVLVRKFTCGTRSSSVDPYQRRIPMNSYVKREKAHGLEPLLSGYFLRIPYILNKKSGYLDHLGEVFLCFETASERSERAHFSQ